GTSTEDDCGVCDGGNADMDCAMECFGEAELDCADVCDGDAEEDDCGVCEGDDTSCLNVLFFGPVVESDDGNTMEVWVSAFDDIAGFQFDVDGVILSDATGGVEDAGWSVEYNPSGTVLGFDLTGQVIAAGSTAMLTTLDFNVADYEGCLTFDNNGALSDASGTSLDVTTGDCVEFTTAMAGCTDMDACNYDMDANVDDESCTFAEENFDCEGNCAVDIDCNEECGGDAVIDECGICEGEGASECWDGTFECNLTDCSEQPTGTVDVMYDSDTAIGGFQFSMEGVEVTGASGGAAEDAGYTVSFSQETGIVIGFSFTGEIIPAGSGILTSLTILGDTSNACLADLVFSDSVGGGLDAEVVDCTTISIGNLSNIELSFGSYDANANTIDIIIDTPYEISGFQFDIVGANILDGTSGLAEDAGFTVSTGGETVLGFSFTGSTIPAGSNGLLTTLTFNNSNNDELCFDLSTGAFVDSNANDLAISLGDCLNLCNGTIDDCGVCDGGNADIDDCGVCFGDGYLDYCGVCNGGNADMDCLGECFGDAYLDDCGDCDGGNAAQDCAGVCDGTSMEDDCGVCDGGNADIDDCGVCFGDGSSCLPVELSFGNISNNSAEIIIYTPHDIAGFQFEIEDVTFIEAYSGIAAQNNFEVLVNNNMILGFSYDGSFIPAGSSGVLTYVNFDSNSDELCYNLGNGGGFYDLDVNYLNTNLSDCELIPQNPEYFTDLPNETGLFDMIIIQNTTGLEYGDEIGLFDNNGIIYSSCDVEDTIGGEILVGSSLWTDNQINITGIIGSDLCDYGQDRLLGANIGNEVKVRVHKAALDIEYDAILEFEIGGLWGDNVTVISNLSAITGCTDTEAENYDPLAAYDDGSCIFTQIVDISTNILNMISFNVNLSELTFEDIFSDSDQIMFSSNDSGEFYIPDYDVNNIGGIKNDGYYTILKNSQNSDISVSVSGTKVDLSTEIILEHHKHNLIPYLPSNSYHVEDIFINISNDILFIANDQGEYWIPSLGVSTLENMDEAKGYVVISNSNEDISFSYDQIGLGLTRRNDISYFDIESLSPNYYNINKTGLSHPIVIENINDDISSGDEIAVYANNLLVGAIKIIDPNSKYIIPVWEKVDKYETYLEGYSYGDDINLRLWKKSTNQELLITHNFNETKFLDQFITYGDISVSDIESSILEFGLSKSYPNPFNPKTNFELNIPLDGYVTVNVYNVMGQLVDVLMDDLIESGVYSLVWNAENVPSGVYMIKAFNENQI
ncbi:T9SS type A sorting domain-containing protein, partial [Candidatus Marinimicrobia bacterium]|nr:T9SS type A sorting domain-containing protein [Candidatus Neomarinimicrobiota bacterium]